MARRGLSESIRGSTFATIIMGVMAHPSGMSSGTGGTGGIISGTVSGIASETVWTDDLRVSWAIGGIASQVDSVEDLRDEPAPKVDAPIWNDDFRDVPWGNHPRTGESIWSKPQGALGVPGARKLRLSPGTVNLILAASTSLCFRSRTLALRATLRSAMLAGLDPSGP